VEINLIAAAIPAFLMLIALEFVIARFRGREVARFNDALTDISCGIGSEMAGLFLKAVVLAGYFFLYEHARLFTLSDYGWLEWGVAFVGVDFGYYCWHRCSHRVHFVWAGHVVHHQSQDYNLAVALRQAWFTSLTSWVFYLPLAIIGVSPEVFAINTAISLLYQFWIHTELIDRLGPLEWVFNTPSHHRVHHGVNPAYIDKNYAAILIIWDRMFSTFEEESEPVVYGTVKGFGSWNPVWANFEHWSYLIGEARQASSWRDRLWLWFAPPEWRPAGLEPYPMPEGPELQARPKWGGRLSASLMAYVGIHSIPVVLGTTAVLWFEESMPLELVLLPASLIVWTTVVWGGFFEGKMWALPMEGLRLLAVLLVAVQLAFLPVWAMVFLVGLILVSAAWLAMAPKRGWLLQGST
jgi:sterol desaturase/sphingolipid hydroxylase (fatty acid hydroxylase superfamily)